MLYGNVPFKGADMKELHKQILDADYQLKDEITSGNIKFIVILTISIEAKDLIKGLLCRDAR